MALNLKKKINCNLKNYTLIGLMWKPWEKIILNLYIFHGNLSAEVKILNRIYIHIKIVKKKIVSSHFFNVYKL